MIHQTYSFVVYPKWHPWYNDNHEAWNVDGHNKKGQLPRKSQFDPQTTISTWKKKKLFSSNYEKPGSHNWKRLNCDRNCESWLPTKPRLRLCLMMSYFAIQRRITIGWKLLLKHSIAPSLLLLVSWCGKTLGTQASISMISVIRWFFNIFWTLKFAHTVQAHWI